MVYPSFGGYSRILFLVIFHKFAEINFYALEPSDFEYITVAPLTGAWVETIQISKNVHFAPLSGLKPKFVWS